MHHKKTPTATDRLHKTDTLKLLLSGFTNQTTVKQKQIVCLIDALPNFHLIGLREIIYDPSRSYQIMDFYNERKSINKKINGQYRQAERRIVIFEFNSLRNLMEILYHEIGHYVYFNVINSSVKKTWVTEIYRESGNISKYACTNASEGFAETYATFLLEPQKLRTIHLKYAYMRDKVFGGFSINLANDHLDFSI